MTRALVLILAAASLAACNPTLSAQSAAPPGRAARLDAINGFWEPKAYRLELSQGVAIAITCNHCGPCEKVRVTSADPAIASVHDGSLGRLEQNGLGNQATSSAMVIVGRAAGSTTIHIDTADGSRDILVTIVPQPALNPQTAVAR